jgi:hypothetical protein
VNRFFKSDDSQPGLAHGVVFPGVAATVAVCGEERFAEFQKLVSKAINCWDDAPAWVVALHDAINCIPEPHSDRAVEEKKREAAK